MSDAVGQLLPYAVGVAVSPVPIVAAILLLSAPRGSAGAFAFLVGWIAGLAIVGTVVLLISGGADASEHRTQAGWVSFLWLALGVACLVGAVRRFRGRPRAGAAPETPKWMDAIDSLPPVRCLGIGVLLSGVNPKNLVLTIAAAASIAQAGISTGEQAGSLAIFVAIATVGVAAPLAIHAAMRERSRELLGEMRVWLTAHNAVIISVLLVLIGAKLIGDAISGFGA